MSLTPHRCKGCHNPETWDFEGGKEFNEEIMESIIQGLRENNIQRSFSILGGEPLCKENLELTALLVKNVRYNYPDIKIYIWTGYTIEQIEKENNILVKYILSLTDYLIDGPYIESERDITLPLRGSRNQRIIKVGVGDKWEPQLN